MARVAIVCETCWNDNVSFRASAYWDVEEQDYTIGDIEESDWCSECDSECVVEEFPIDDKDEIQFPSVDEIIESENTDHMVAKGERLNDEADIAKLYHAILTQYDGNCHSLDDKVRFVRFVDCDPTPVEDLLLDIDSASSGRSGLMATYILRVHRGNTQKVTDGLIALASKKNDPGMLQALLRPYENPLPEAEIDRIRTVFKLLGGKDDNVYR